MKKLYALCFAVFPFLFSCKSTPPPPVLSQEPKTLFSVENVYPQPILIQPENEWERSGGSWAFISPSRQRGACKAIEQTYSSRFGRLELEEDIFKINDIIVAPAGKPASKCGLQIFTEKTYKKLDLTVLETKLYTKKVNSYIFEINKLLKDKDVNKSNNPEIAAWVLMLKKIMEHKNNDIPKLEMRYIEELYRDEIMYSLFGFTLNSMERDQRKEFADDIYEFFRCKKARSYIQASHGNCTLPFALVQPLEQFDSPQEIQAFRLNLRLKAIIAEYLETEKARLTQLVENGATPVETYLRHLKLIKNINSFSASILPYKVNLPVYYIDSIVSQAQEAIYQSLIEEYEYFLAEKIPSEPTEGIKKAIKLNRKAQYFSNFYKTVGKTTPPLLFPTVFLSGFRGINEQVSMSSLNRNYEVLQVDGVYVSEEKYKEYGFIMGNFRPWVSPLQITDNINQTTRYSYYLLLDKYQKKKLAEAFSNIRYNLHYELLAKEINSIESFEEWIAYERKNSSTSSKSTLRVPSNPYGLKLSNLRKERKAQLTDGNYKKVYSDYLFKVRTGPIKENDTGDFGFVTSQVSGDYLDEVYRYYNENKSLIQKKIKKDCRNDDICTITVYNNNKESLARYYYSGYWIEITKDPIVKLALSDQYKFEYPVKAIQRSTISVLSIFDDDDYHRYAKYHDYNFRHLGRLYDAWGQLYGNYCLDRNTLSSIVVTKRNNFTWQEIVSNYYWDPAFYDRAVNLGYYNESIAMYPLSFRKTRDSSVMAVINHYGCKSKEVQLIRKRLLALP